MKIYKVWVGRNTDLETVVLVEARSCGEAEKKAVKKVGVNLDDGERVVKIEEMGEILIR